MNAFPFHSVSTHFALAGSHLVRWERQELIEELLSVLLEAGDERTFVNECLQAGWWEAVLRYVDQRKEKREVLRGDGGGGGAMEEEEEESVTGSVSFSTYLEAIYWTLVFAVVEDEKDMVSRIETAVSSLSSSKGEAEASLFWERLLLWNNNVNVNGAAKNLPFYDEQAIVPHIATTAAQSESNDERIDALSTRPLARLFTRSLAPLSHLLASLALSAALIH